MRTTILLSSLLFLAGYASAQDDSPITVGDTGTQRPPFLAARAPRGSSYVRHAQFRYNNGFFVLDPGYQVACFGMVPDVNETRRDIASLANANKEWTLTLNTGVVLKSKDGQRIDIDYDHVPVDTNATFGGEQEHDMAGYPLTWGKLSIKGGKTTTYPPGSDSIKPASPLQLVIHYCLNGDCKDPITGADPCNPLPQK